HVEQCDGADPRSPAAVAAYLAPEVHHRVAVRRLGEGGEAEPVELRSYLVLTRPDPLAATIDRHTWHPGHRRRQRPAADTVTCLDDQDVPARSGEPVGCDQTSQPSTDNDGLHERAAYACRRLLAALSEISAARGWRRGRCPSAAPRTGVRAQRTAARRDR